MKKIITSLTEWEEEDPLLKNQLPKDLEQEFPFRITKYYANLIKQNKYSKALMKTILPSSLEKIISKEETIDPLQEQKNEVLPRLVHKYPNKVLILTIDTCACYCRYCTRMYFVGKKSTHITTEEFENILLYLKSHPNVTDVLLSGGDPLLLPISLLESMIFSLKKIKNIQTIRIGTKVPIVFPEKVDNHMQKMLGKFSPIWMNVHTTLPEEITEEVKEISLRLIKQGVLLGSQTVLLKGVNDSSEILTNLFLKLISIGIRPYYLYHCDLIPGRSHFRTSLMDGINILKSLRGKLPGYAIPQYIVDSPHGKIPINEFTHHIEKDNIVLETWQNYMWKFL